MKTSAIKTLKNILIASTFLLTDLTIAEQLTIYSANNYPYKNLINRTKDVKVFYITNEDKLSCRVEIVFGSMKWISVEKKVNSESFKNNPLSNCLSPEKAEQLLWQSYLQFGHGL